VSGSSRCFSFVSLIANDFFSFSVSAVKFSTQQEYLIVSLVLATIESDPTGRGEQEEEPQPQPISEQRPQQSGNNNKNRKTNQIKPVQQEEEQEEEPQPVVNRKKITETGERKSILFTKSINEDEEETEAEQEEDSRTVKQEPVETNPMEGLVSKRSLDAMTDRRVANPNPANNFTSSASPQKKAVVNPRKRWLEDSSQDE
jgi:flagellar biosynthesis GTPase FlhF